MTSISTFMAGGHKTCDEAFARAEQAASRSDWPAAATGFETFHAAITRHIAMEEGVLFPALDEATGMSGGGPIRVMRIEHEQMRGLFDAMKQALATSDSNQYLGHCETLLVLLQQHNVKEERILYPMMDKVLGARADDLVARCTAVPAQAA